MTRMLNISRGVRQKPVRLCVYGPPGVGKSSFAACAPNPIFLGEEGSDYLDVARFPSPRTWGELLHALEIVERHQDFAEFQTLVLDTLDYLEQAVIFPAVCEEEGVEAGKVGSIEGIPYGRGYGKALAYWRWLLGTLEHLQSIRPLNVILLAHSRLSKFHNPDGEDFDRWQLAITDSPKADAAKLIYGWVDDQLFANWKITTRGPKKGKKKGHMGDRRLYTERTAAFDAKNRCHLRKEFSLSWNEYWDARLRHIAPQVDPELVEEARQALLDLPNELRGPSQQAEDGSVRFAFLDRAVAGGNARIRELIGYARKQKDDLEEALAADEPESEEAVTHG